MLNDIDLEQDSKSKDRRIYVLILTLLFVLAFTLRVTNLTFLEPTVDEYAQLNAAKAVFLGEGTSYVRAFPLTHAIAFLFKIFGESLLVARMPGVIFGALTVLPFYWMFRKTNRTIGLIAAGLWAISPWAIAVSRTVREYAIFPFFYLLFFIFLVRFGDHILDHLEGRHRMRLSQAFLYGTVAALPLAYGVIIDPFSTFSQIIILYFAFVLYLIVHVVRSEKVSTLFKRVAGFTFVAGLATYFFLPQFASHLHVSMVPTLNSYYPKLLFLNTETQWFSAYGILGFYAALAAGVFAAIKSLLRNRRHVVGFALLSFVSYLYFFTFHFARYNRPRYVFSIHIWLIPLVAAGIYALYRLLRPAIKRRPLAAIPLVIVVLLTFNPGNTYLAFTMDKHGYAPITNEYHHQYLPVLEKYGDQMRRDDVIICSLCSPLIWYGQVDLMTNNLHVLKERGEERYAEAEIIVNGSDHGWMIIDQRRDRIGGGFLHENLIVQEKEVLFLEENHGFFIYKW